ncbi:Ig-like domain-containing protein [Pseudomonadota bacterium]
MIGLFLALTWTSPAFSAPVQNNPDNRANAEALTHSLVGLNTAYQKAAPAAKPQALQQLIDATVERQARLAELVETDPGAVLRVAMPDRIRKQMPAEVQAFIEQRLEIEGELEVMYEDYDDGSHRLVHALKTDGERIALHFKSPPPGLLSGMPAQVSGVLVGDAMAVDSGKDDILTLALGGGVDGGTNGGPAAPLSNTFGQQRTAVILVNFPSDPSEPWTVAEAQDVVFGAISDFFWENSYGQTWLTGDVFGWFTIPVDPAGCPSGSIELKAREAVEGTGVDLSVYDRFIYAFPDIGCSWGGQASVGGLPTNVWLDGTLMSEGTVSHEMGHNFGLFHSHSMWCGVNVNGDDVCNTSEYGDVLDRMGNATGGGHFNISQKERLGWLEFGDSPTIVTADVSGNYRLEPVSLQASGVKGLRVLMDENLSTGQRTSYYLETRQAIGFDEFLSNSPYEESVLNGLVFHLKTENDPGSSYLLDMTPNSLRYDFNDLALPSGASYTDAAAGVTISLLDISESGATVNVSFGPQSCVRADPSIDPSPSESDWVVPGTSVDYTVAVSNNDSTACPDATIGLTDQIPTGWTAAFTNPTVSLAPGASVLTSLTITSSASAPDGVYNIGVTATHAADSVYTSSASTAYTVMAEVGSSNSPPVAMDDNETLAQVQPTVINILANDWDPDNDAIWVTHVSQGAKGTVVINNDGSLTYSPGRRFKNKDSFGYEITDGTDTATAVVSISVQESPKGGGKPRK